MTTFGKTKRTLGRYSRFGVDPRDYDARNTNCDELYDDAHRRPRHV